MLLLFALGYVASGASDGFNVAAGIDNRNENVLVNTATMGAGERDLAANGAFGGDDLINFAIVHRGMPRLVAEFEAIFTDGFIPGATPHREQGVVGVSETMVAVEDVNQIGSIR